MSTVQFIVHCSAVVVSKPSSDSHALAFSVSKIHTIHAAIASFVHKRRCASCLAGRLPSKAGTAEFATTYLPDCSEIVSDHISTLYKW